ncbi:hypothetical protein Mal35_20460 [Gimesia maris]|nr:hypothetical protein Mal35_20460 [Gimesia maris]
MDSIQITKIFCQVKYNLHFTCIIFLTPSVAVFKPWKPAQPAKLQPFKPAQHAKITMQKPKTTTESLRLLSLTNGTAELHQGHP